MRLDRAELEKYHRLGYVVVPCPFPTELTADALRAVEKVASDPETHPSDTRKNHFRLAPQVEGSYWSVLDHSLPLLRIELHAEIIEIARQLIGNEDIFFRNGGINELAPERSFLWHRDTEDNYAEFMHYFSGSDTKRGCLRVVPESHQQTADRLVAQVTERRRVRGDAEPASMEGMVDVELKNEVSLELGPKDLLVRSSRIFHATWKNKSNTGRLMHHWLFRSSESPNHRFRFEEYLTPKLIARLTNEQRQILWLGRDFDIDPRYGSERKRELGRVRWSTLP